ncbi:hypothetical protein JD969_07895 [Planctomycetota bacterium]|nr:hypothetical protein JD969_07895 [Planctomycetota bacterium]
MKIFAKLATLLITTATLTMTATAANITFDDLAPATIIPLVGSPVHPQTQPVTTFTTGGYTLRLDHYYNTFWGTLYPTDGATVTAPSFGMSTNSLFLNSTSLYIDFVENGIAPPAQVIVDYVEIDPGIPIENGALYNVNNYPRFLKTGLGAGYRSLGVHQPWHHNGATLTNTIHSSIGNIHTGTLNITLTNPGNEILSLSFGSSNLYIENIAIVPVPEPASFVMLSLVSLTLIRRR